jgi:lipopolysaccharide/colanic/teichoic acid biosynthesis glycosyltransferase
MRPSRKTWTYDLLKRSYDLIFASLGLILLAPIMLVIAFMVKVDSKGPVIYKGIRSGLNFSVFKIYKFRTMVANAEDIGGAVTAESDFRVTRLGKALRKYKLDELPQLFNVLEGKMSIVGPRPEVPLYTSQYTEEEKIILSVKPGITDFSSIHFVQLASAVGFAKDKEQFEKNIDDVLKTKTVLRIKYVLERSLKTDVKIIFLTVMKLLKSFK